MSKENSQQKSKLVKNICQEFAAWAELSFWLVYILLGES